MIVGATLKKHLIDQCREAVPQSGSKLDAYRTLSTDAKSNKLMFSLANDADTSDTDDDHAIGQQVS